MGKNMWQAMLANPAPSYEAPMREDYNDAGRRTMKATEVHKRGDRMKETGTAQIRAGRKNANEFAQLLQMLQENPPLKEQLKTAYSEGPYGAERNSALQAELKKDPAASAKLDSLKGHVMTDAILGGGMGPMEAMEISPEGIGQGRDFKVRSIEELKRVQRILAGEE